MFVRRKVNSYKTQLAAASHTFVEKSNLLYNNTVQFNPVDWLKRLFVSWKMALYGGAPKVLCPGIKKR